MLRDKEIISRFLYIIFLKTEDKITKKWYNIQKKKGEIGYVKSIKNDTKR